MMAALKRPQAFPGVLVGAFLAVNVAAHPLDEDDLAQNRVAGGSALAALPAGSGQPAGAGHAGSAEVAGWLPANPAQAGDLWSADPLLEADRETAAPLFVEAPSELVSDADFAAIGEADPLARAVRSVVNVRRSRSSAVSPPRTALPGEPAAPAFVGDVSAAVLKMEEGLAEVVSEALDARVDDDGRVTFSLAGVDGLHVTAEDGEIVLGHGDSVFALSQREDRDLERRIAVLDAARDAEQRSAARSFNPVRAITDLAVRVVEYPLFWVLLLLALIGKLALVIASAQNRRHAQRRSSGSEAAQPQRKRIRLKRVRTRIRLPQSV